MDASHVYVGALALGCFYSHISTGTLRRALTASLDSCAEIKSIPLQWRTKSGRVWRKVPESDARSVPHAFTSGTPTSPPAHPLHVRQPFDGVPFGTFKPVSECVVHTVSMKSSPQTPADLRRFRVPIRSCAMSRRDTLLLSRLIHRIQSLDL